MKTYLLNFWDTLRTSFWFMPSVFASGALMLSLVVPRLDAAVIDNGGRIPDWIRTTPETGRATLSAMAGAMVAVTGTVFSITIVTLSLTSQQFGPRLLRRFMFDLPTQLTLGVFLSTGLYCLLVLRIVEPRGEGSITPHLSVMTAVFLAVISMGMLIYFIHHVAILIQAPKVVAAVARDLDDAIQRLFPEKLGQPANRDRSDSAVVSSDSLRPDGDYICIRSHHEGYVQAVDVDGLMHLATKHNLVVDLRTRPGNFLATGSRLAFIWKTDKQNADDLETDEFAETLNEMFIVGSRRTPRQDVECAIDELVEVAVRALSPGINDPFTAINCIDRLGAAMARLAQRKMPHAHRTDGDNRLRVIAELVSFPDALDAAFNQIRQYGRDSVAVTIRTLEALAHVAEYVCRDEDRAAVRIHAEMVSRLAASCSEAHDSDEVQDRFHNIIQALDQRRTTK